MDSGETSQYPKRKSRGLTTTMLSSKTNRTKRSKKSTHPVFQTVFDFTPSVEDFVDFMCFKGTELQHQKPELTRMAEQCNITVLNPETSKSCLAFIR
ncbi:hypothetical protein GJ496_010068 [Pomphorhynchus laevis]|nr:hypothetical protein GJ496_010068 [Pomphorhynchus laevis]